MGAPGRNTTGCVISACLVLVASFARVACSARVNIQLDEQTHAKNDRSAALLGEERAFLRILSWKSKRTKRRRSSRKRAMSLGATEPPRSAAKRHDTKAAQMKTSSSQLKPKAKAGASKATTKSAKANAAHSKQPPAKRTRRASVKQDDVDEDDRAMPRLRPRPSKLDRLDLNGTWMEAFAEGRSELQASMGFPLVFREWDKLRASKGNWLMQVMQKGDEVNLEVKHQVGGPVKFSYGMFKFQCTIGGPPSQASNLVAGGQISAAWTDGGRAIEMDIKRTGILRSGRMIPKGVVRKNDEGDTIIKWGPYNAIWKRVALLDHPFSTQYGTNVS